MIKQPNDLKDDRNQSYVEVFPSDNKSSAMLSDVIKVFHSQMSSDDSEESDAAFEGFISDDDNSSSDSSNYYWSRKNNGISRFDI